MKRPFSTLALALVAALALTACGSDDSTTSGNSKNNTFNAADVTFAQSMIPHHEQAVQMSKMAKAHASVPEVKRLAERIETAQGPEITTMQKWLKDWGKDQPSSSMGDMDHGGMPGMMSDDDMSALGRATGAGFDKMFLTMMVAHHTGAVSMARTEQSTGKDTGATALAKKIEAAQTAEIAEMDQLLNG